MNKLKVDWQMRHHYVVSGPPELGPQHLVPAHQNDTGVRAEVFFERRITVDRKDRACLTMRCHRAGSNLPKHVSTHHLTDALSS